jgi:hypothetical protein
MTLETIRSADFVARLGYDLPADVMRLALKRTPELKVFQQQYRAGEITDDMLQAYVDQLMADFRRGEKFRFDATLAFLAVAVESVISPFANRFLDGLGSVRLVEMPLSPRVARTVLEHRKELSANSRREFLIQRPPLSEGSQLVNNSGSKNEPRMEIVLP